MVSWLKIYEKSQLPQFVKRPTANSTQSQITANVITIPIAIRYLGNFLAKKTNAEPVPNNKIPATIKSARVQPTPLENCIATEGTSNNNPITSAIQRKTLFCIIMPLFVIFIGFLLYDQLHVIYHSLLQFP